MKIVILILVSFVSSSALADISLGGDYAVPCTQCIKGNNANMVKSAGGSMAIGEDYRGMDLSPDAGVGSG